MIEDDSHHGEKREPLLEDIFQHAGHRIGHQRHVVDHAGNQTPRGIRIVIPDRQPDEFAEQLLPDVRDHLVADIVHEIVLAIVECALEHGNRKQGEGKGQQQRFILIDEDLVENRFHQPGVGSGEGRHQPRADERRDQADPVGSQVAHEPYETIYA